jgi:uncharacterized membrane protein
MVEKTEEDQKICIYLPLKTYTEIKPVIYLFMVYLATLPVVQMNNKLEKMEEIGRSLLYGAIFTFC